jgi:hypothetical protein
MARRKADRRADHGMRRARTNAVAAYLTALEGGASAKPFSPHNGLPRRPREPALSEGSALNPVEGLFGSGQGSLPSRSLLKEAQGCGDVETEAMGRGPEEDN